MGPAEAAVVDDAAALPLPPSQGSAEQHIPALGLKEFFFVDQTQPLDASFPHRENVPTLLQVFSSGAAPPQGLFITDASAMVSPLFGQ
jgi:SOS-response transcriptional repressor LexA